MTTDKNLLRRMWESFLETVNRNISAETERVERALGLSRLGEQLWNALAESENGWACPFDVYIGDDGSSLFTIVAQGGKLYQVPLTVSQDNLSLGAWTQVTEVFEPVTQSQVRVIRQKDGTHRWVCIAGTTVLNRQAEIDSSELFDSFIHKARKDGKYPRLDFYHLGEADPKLWEFGTADYLAREGVCYLASGTFDEGHPLAEALIQSCEGGCDQWGNSIEFYAYAEPEILVLDAEVDIQVPIYKSGENTRISVVLEKDAAGLFTRMIEINEEKRRTMDPRTVEALTLLLGEEAAAAYIENVDAVNRTVKNDKLIHRKKDPNPPPPEDDDEDTEDGESDEDEEDTPEEPVAQELVLDAETLQLLTQQVLESAAIKQITEKLQTVTEALTTLAVERDKDTQEITRLKKLNTQLIKRVDALSVEDTQKKQIYLEDQPKRKQTVVTYRKRDEVVENDEELNSTQIAERTLSKLPSY